MKRKVLTAGIFGAALLIAVVLAGCSMIFGSSEIYIDGPGTINKGSFGEYHVKAGGNYVSGGNLDWIFGAEGRSKPYDTRMETDGGRCVVYIAPTETIERVTVSAVVKNGLFGKKAHPSLEILITNN
jgi:hypothetical protein